LPSFPGMRRFLAALAVDALGTGLFLPFTILYFLRVVGLSPAEVGIGLGLSGVLAAAAVPLFGVAIDRLGPVRAGVMNLALRGVLFATYLLMGPSLPLFVVLVGLAAAGDRTWPPTSQTLVAELVPAESRITWLGAVRTLRFAALGVGTAASGALVSLGSSTVWGYRSVLIGNAVSFLVAALLLASLGRRVTPRAPHPAQQGGAGGYRLVLADADFRRLLLLCVPLGVCYTALTVALPVWLVDGLGASNVAAGLVLSLNTFAVVFFQLPVALRAARYPLRRTLSAAGLVFAVSYGLLAVAGHVPSGLLGAYIVLAVGLLSLGELMFSPTSAAAVTDLAPERLRGRYLSAFQLIFVGINSLGPAVLVPMLLTHPAATWGFLAVLLAVTGGLGLLTTLRVASYQ
jgi:MFS family permease